LPGTRLNQIGILCIIHFCQPTPIDCGHMNESSKFPQFHNYFFCFSKYVGENEEE
jgi:hypothetical protein